MNESDIVKIDFIKVNLQVDNLLAIIKLISRAELVKTIEMVPEEQRRTFNFQTLKHTLTFMDSIENEYVNSISDGPNDLE